MKRILFLILIYLLLTVAPSLAAEDRYPAPGEAKKILAELLSQYPQNPSNPALLKQIGLCYHSLGASGDADAVVKAAEFFQKALDLNPNDNVVRAWLGSSVAMRARDAWMFDKMTYSKKGIYLLDMAVSSDPKNVDVRLIRGNTYLMMPSFIGKDEIAIEDFEFIAQRLKEENASENKKQEIYYKLGLIYKKTKNIEKARSSFKDAITLSPNSEIARQIEKDENLR